MTPPTSARAWLDLLLDPGWSLRFEDVVGGDPLSFPGYRAQLDDARARSGASESLLVARGAVRGHDVVALSSEFAFLGGSMGTAAGERIARAFELAAAEGVPVVGMLASGGARMQEGMAALVQMPKTLVARGSLERARRPFVAYLRNPATGGVYASFASSADLVWAEPGATIGFAGPRVVEALTGRSLPPGSHTAESARDAGAVDEVVAPADLAARVAGLLETLEETVAESDSPDEPEDDGSDAWTRVQRARRADRPRGYLELRAPLRSFATDASLTAAIARAGGRAVVAVQQVPGGGPATPRGYRTARHAIAVATRLRLPVVTLVDTPGADASAEAERDGIARELTLTFESLLAAPVPTVACVTGEGGSGGALALSVCDRLLIQENAFFSVIAPEGAAAILRRDDVARMASDLRLTAFELRRLGIADRVVPEPPGGAHADPATARTLVDRAIAWALHEAALPTQQARLERWRLPA